MIKEEKGWSCQAHSNSYMTDSGWMRWRLPGKGTAFSKESSTHDRSTRQSVTKQQKVMKDVRARKMKAQIVTADMTTSFVKFKGLKAVQQLRQPMQARFMIRKRRNRKNTPGLALYLERNLPFWQQLYRWLKRSATLCLHSQHSTPLSRIFICSFLPPLAYCLSIHCRQQASCTHRTLPVQLQGATSSPSSSPSRHMRHSLGPIMGELLNSMVSIVDFLDSLLEERALRGRDGLILPLSTSSMLYIIVSFIEAKRKAKQAVKERYIWQFRRGKG